MSNLEHLAREADLIARSLRAIGRAVLTIPASPTEAEALIALREAFPNSHGVSVSRELTLYKHDTNGTELAVECKVWTGSKFFEAPTLELAVKAAIESTKKTTLAELTPPAKVTVRDDAEADLRPASSEPF
jgi:hypothetical protein